MYSPADANECDRIVRAVATRYAPTVVAMGRSKLKILSPFDNLLIQRKRTQALFGFDYLLECYTPAAKRRHGYFALPILWKGKLVARMDCKVERRRKELAIYQLSLEPGTTDLDAFSHAYYL